MDPNATINTDRPLLRSATRSTTTTTTIINAIYGRSGPDIRIPTDGATETANDDITVHTDTFDPVQSTL
jgi:hypothetical protein